MADCTVSPLFSMWRTKMKIIEAIKALLDSIVAKLKSVFVKKRNAVEADVKADAIKAADAAKAEEIKVAGAIESEANKI